MDDLKQRLQAATEGVTPGPWVFTEWGIDAEAAKWGELLRPVGGHIYDEYDQDSPTIQIRDEDARFIAAARQLVPEAAAALDAKDAEIARVKAIARSAIDEWASWVHDQLDGTSSLAEAIAEVDAARAALTDSSA